MYATAGQDVDTVIVDGEVLMRGRKVLTVAETEVLAAAHREATAAFARAGVTEELLMPAGIWGKGS